MGRLPFVKYILLSLLATAICIPALAGKRKKESVPAQQFPYEYPQLHPTRDVAFIPVALPERTINVYDTISITFIGDVMQHGKQLQSALANSSDPDSPHSYNYTYTFRYIKEKLQASNLAVANMEFPLGTPPYKGYPAFSAPESIAWQAKECGIDLFLLANNHLLDRGKRGLLNTINCYEQMGSKYIGVYKDSTQERLLNPVLYNIKGIRIAFLNFTYGTNGFEIPHPCTVNLMDTAHIKECIARAKNMGADIIVAAPHWGNEYSLTPSYHQKKWAGFLIEEGVRVIVGSHPHVPQSAQITPQNIIFYSLGNYISNQSTPNYTQLELMVTITIVKNSITGEIILPEPHYEFLWCFKKDEFDPDYTVVPVKDILGKEHLVKDKNQYKRMESTYKSVSKLLNLPK